MKKFLFAALTGAMIMSGCQHTNDEPQVAAVLVNTDQQIRTIIENTVSELLGKKIALNANAFIQSSIVTLEPKTLGNDASLEKATRLKLLKQGEVCLILNQESGRSLALPGVVCRAE